MPGVFRMARPATVRQASGVSRRSKVVELPLDGGTALHEVAVLVVGDPDVHVDGLVGQRRRGDDLGAAEREVPQLVDGDLADVAGALHDPGIAGHHPLDVRDDDDLVGVHVVAEHQRGRVGAAAAERRHVAGAVLGDEAADDRHVPLGGHVGRQLPGAAAALLDVDLAVFVGDHRPLVHAGLDELRVDAAGAQGGLQHPHGGPLAHRDDFGLVGLVGLEADGVEQEVRRRPHRRGDDGDLVAGLDGRGD